MAGQDERQCGRSRQANKQHKHVHAHDSRSTASPSQSSKPPSPHAANSPPEHRLDLDCAPHALRVQHRRHLLALPLLSLLQWVVRKPGTGLCDLWCWYRKLALWCKQSQGRWSSVEGAAAGCTCAYQMGRAPPIQKPSPHLSSPSPTNVTPTAPHLVLPLLLQCQLRTVLLLHLAQPPLVARVRLQGDGRNGRSVDKAWVEAGHQLASAGSAPPA